LDQDIQNLFNAVDNLLHRLNQAYQTLPYLANAGIAGVGEAAENGAWRLSPLARGNAIEDTLAVTEYKDWYRVGAEVGGKFPLVDFQQGQTLVSLKTVNTSGSAWLGQMQTVIDNLATSGATVNGAPANMVLDLRVQPGGAGAAQSLVGYGQQQGITVIIKEFP